MGLAVLLSSGISSVSTPRGLISKTTEEMAVRHCCREDSSIFAELCGPDSLQPLKQTIHFLQLKYGNFCPLRSWPAGSAMRLEEFSWFGAFLIYLPRKKKKCLLFFTYRLQANHASFLKESMGNLNHLWRPAAGITADAVST